MRKNSLIICTFIFLFIHLAHSQNFPIGEITTTLTDASRSNRQIGVEIFYPAVSAGSNTLAANGLFPVIAFGHGFSMTYDAYSNFWNEFVPQGYILIFPKTETGPIPFPSHNEFAQDLNYCLNYLLSENNNSSSPFFGKISGKTALLGHSMGGGCSFLAAANNPTIGTVVTFAPAETNPSAIAAAASITVPTLIFIGSKDNVSPASGNSADLYNAANSSCKNLLTLTDGSHCGFAESNFLCEFGESSVCLGCSFIPRAQQHALTFQFLNPWLRFYLKGECPQFYVFQNLLNATSGITSQQSCNYFLPVAAFTVSGSTSFCVGGSVSFAASGNYNFLWSTGETTPAITVSQSGDYSLIVSDAYDCSDTSALATVDVYTNPSPALLAQEDLKLCSGEENELYLDDVFVAYLWNDGSTDSTLSVSESGAYFAEVTDASGCEGVSDTLLIEVNPLPDEPMIELRNDTLFVISGMGNFQWYRNDSLLIGANNNFIVTDVEGDYHVQVSDTNDCSAISSIVNFVFTSLMPFSADSKPFFFPNPTDGKISLKGDASMVSVFNVAGRKIYEQLFNATMEINLVDFTPGVYVMRSGDEVFKVIKR